MATSHGRATWDGSLSGGSGKTELHTSGAGSFDVTWNARTAPGAGMTTPEELIAAAHAACYSMALSHELEAAGFSLTTVQTDARVEFNPEAGITGIALTTRAEVPDISDEEFSRIAEATRTGCPVSAALSAVPITLDATLA